MENNELKEELKELLEKYLEIEISEGVVTVYFDNCEITKTDIR